VAPSGRLRRTARLKAKGKSRFPKRRDPKYRRWVWMDNYCLLRGRVLQQRFSPIDVRTPDGVYHHCWGPIDPAHVGKHQARGAGDVGVLLPLCRAAHRFYDERRSAWEAATGFSEQRMADAALGLYAKYQTVVGS
jgi:hypothetical protein